MLYIFNKDEVLLEIIDNFYDDEYKRVLNKDYTYTFKIDIKDSNNIKRKNKVGLYDENEVLQLFTIEEIETNYFNEDALDVFCQHDFYSLNDKIIEDKRILDGTCAEALTKALEGTNYKVGDVAEFHTATLNYYFISSLKAVNEIIDTYGGELDFRFELNEDKTAIANRYVDIKYRLGEDTGIRFTYDTNLKEVIRTEVMDNHYTVLYGRGASLETENGGNTRLITFEDVTWESPINPGDKPLGDKFIEDVDAIAKWGRIEGVYENKDIEDPVELLQYTWDKLQETKEPNVSYKVMVDDLAGVVGYEHLKANLGDTIIILDDEYDINLESRIIEEKYSIRDIESTKEITLGYILPSISDSSGGNIIGGGSNEEDKPQIDGGNFPNRLPDIPVVSTKSRFATIELSWTYENKMYYTYEVYASQLENFNPTSDNLVFKGQASVFLHEIKPKQTWYYRVRAGNTHGKYTEFSNQVSESTTKIEDGSEYFENAAIGSALIGSLNADVIDSGTIKGTYIDARNLSVTDGNGNKTLDIDSFGRVTILPSNFTISSGCVTNIPTKDEVGAEIFNAKKEVNENIEDVQTNVNDLKDYTNGAFKDNLLTEDEKSKISGFLKPLETELADITKEYNTIYSNSDLIGEYKTNLKNSYDSYKLKYDGLITTINSLLKLSVITEQNKIALDTAYEAHDTMLANYRQRVNEAIDSIATKKKNDALDGSKTYTNAQIKVVNDSISHKVSKTEYDENNNIVNEKFVEMELSLDGVKIESSKSAQNLLYGSGFNNTTRHWYTHSYKVENAQNLRYRAEVNGEWGIPGVGRLTIQADRGGGFEYGVAQIVSVSPNTDYTFTCYMAAHRAYGQVIIRNSDSSWISSKSNITANGGQDINNWHKVKITFNSGSNTEIKIQISMHYAERDGYVWACMPMLNQGEIAKGYSQHPNEITSDHIMIDGQTGRANHTNGDFTQMHSRGLERYRSNGDLKGSYHYLMHQGTVYCNSEQYVRVNLPSDFHGKKINAVAAAACIGTGTDAWDKPEPLVSFWAEVNKIAPDSSWVEFYASTRQNRDGSILTQHKGIKFAYWITA